MAGDRITGIQAMQMTEGLDEGPILASESLRIDALETAGTLHDRLAVLGAGLIVKTLEGLERGALTATPQASDGLTYAKKIRRSRAARIDRSPSGRGGGSADPRPFCLSSAWFMAPSDKGPVRVKALLSSVEDGAGAPGTVLDDALLIACGTGAVRLLRAQREGRAAQDAAVFLRGFALPAGGVLS